MPYLHAVFATASCSHCSPFTFHRCQRLVCFLPCLVLPPTLFAGLVERALLPPAANAAAHSVNCHLPGTFCRRRRNTASANNACQRAAPATTTPAIPLIAALLPTCLTHPAQPPRRAVGLGSGLPFAPGSYAAFAPFAPAAILCAFCVLDLPPAAAARLVFAFRRTLLAALTRVRSNGFKPPVPVTPLLRFGLLPACNSNTDNGRVPGSPFPYCLL